MTTRQETLHYFRNRGPRGSYCRASQHLAIRLDIMWREVYKVLPAWIRKLLEVK